MARIVGTGMDYFQNKKKIHQIVISIDIDSSAKPTQPGNQREELLPAVAASYRNILKQVRQIEKWIWKAIFNKDKIGLNWPTATKPNLQFILDNCCELNSTIDLIDDLKLLKVIFH